MLIDKYYKYIKKMGLNKAVRVPNEMMVKNSEDDEGWVEWKLAQSKLSIQDIKEITNKYQIDLPQDYIDFIMYKQFLDIEILNYTIHGINALETLDKEASLLPDSLLEEGFFPIGNIDDADYIALNTKNGKVVRLSFEEYSEVEILSENFSTMIKFLEELLEKKVNQ